MARPKGSLNKDRKTVFELVRAAGRDPLEVLCDLMNNSDDENIRVVAAKEVAQYIHTKRPRELNISGDVEMTMRIADKLKEVQELPFKEKLLRIEAAKKKLIGE